MEKVNMSTVHHINPRFRAYGKARIDVTRRARDEIEWQMMWREPLNPFPFEFPGSWQFCAEYKVDDYAAEVGFFIDVLGFPALAFSPSYAQFTSPDGGFCLGVMAAKPGERSTDPETLRFQFMVEDIHETAQMLEQRGIRFEQKPVQESAGSSRVTATFRTPHGVRMDLWGEVPPKADIHTLMEEEEEDDAEADRIIQQLLDLNAGDDVDVEREFDEEELESAVADESELDQHPPAEARIDDVEQDDPLPPAPPPKERTAPPEKLPRQPASNPSRNSDYKLASQGPFAGKNGNGELTYTELEDESGDMGAESI
jgi:predicted enzyme related to lactoylglutathione lyase